MPSTLTQLKQERAFKVKESAGTGQEQGTKGGEEAPALPQGILGSPTAGLNPEEL